MKEYRFTLSGAFLRALGSGALWWPAQNLLCVSDLHLGKSERIVRRGGAALPPYEVRDTLARLAQDLAHTQARTVICLGDSFDDLEAAKALPEPEQLWIASLQAGRDWFWIEGNHDAGPINLGGSLLKELTIKSLTFRHIATQDTIGEISGHYHPKARVQTRARSISRPAFLCDTTRVIMPAYGTYTGGLRSNDMVLKDLMMPEANAILTGPVPTCVPMPR
ncbi:MAG: ligase-associated DNA damage response endonuclease PdeM [Sulfitobacter sp.]